MSSMEHKITVVSFDRGHNTSIPGFRGAVASLFPDDAIYHNHEGDSVIYRYPLIQYKIIDGTISLIGIDEGADSVEKNFHLGQSLHLSVHGEENDFKITDKKTFYYIPESFEEQNRYYFLRGWLPLNQENHIRYCEMETISEKIAMLDSILSANILSLFSGFGYHSEQKSKASILEIVSSRTVRYKDAKLLAFDIRFKCNASLPELCGLGKGASRGFGILHESHPRNHSIHSV